MNNFFKVILTETCSSRKDRRMAPNRSAKKPECARFPLYPYFINALPTASFTEKTPYDKRVSAGFPQIHLTYHYYYYFNNKRCAGAHKKIKRLKRKKFCSKYDMKPIGKELP